MSFCHFIFGLCSQVVWRSHQNSAISCRGYVITNTEFALVYVYYKLLYCVISIWALTERAYSNLLFVKESLLLKRKQLATMVIRYQFWQQQKRAIYLFIIYKTCCCVAALISVIYARIFNGFKILHNCEVFCLQPLVLFPQSENGVKYIVKHQSFVAIASDLCYILIVVFVKKATVLRKWFAWYLNVYRHHQL